jgi:protein-disulfide isomerase
LLFVFAVLITVRRVSATAWRNGADDDISSESAAVRQAPKLLIPGEHGVGCYMANLEFFDLQGTSTTLHINPSPPLTVVAFTSTSCPLSRKYLPTLVELHREFSARGIRFILVNCIATDEADDMREAAAKFTTNIEYVPDPDRSS